MKITTGLLIAAAAFVAVKYFGNLGVAVNTVQFIINGFRVNSPTDYVVTLLVQNVSNAQVTVNAMTGAVTINGDAVGNISDFQAVTVPATGQATVDIHVTPNLLSIPGAILDLINSSGQSIDLKITGNANVNSLVLPFTIENNINV